MFGLQARESSHSDRPARPKCSPEQPKPRPCFSISKELSGECITNLSRVRFGFRFHRTYSTGKALRSFYYIRRWFQHTRGIVTIIGGGLQKAWLVKKTDTKRIHDPLPPVIRSSTNRLRVPSTGVLLANPVSGINKRS